VDFRAILEKEKVMPPVAPTTFGAICKSAIGNKKLSVYNYLTFLNLMTI
jgi:hypothetical protein